MGCGTHFWGASFNFLRTLEMKKFAMSAIAVAAVLGAGAANAYTSGTFSNGFVVPNVIKNDATGVNTAVGIINQSGGPVPVYWTFFDQDSKHVTDGCFTMTDKDFMPFVWSAHSGTGMDDKRGYLLFVSGGTSATGACLAAPALSSATGLISGQAFYVDPGSKDVAYAPVIDGSLTLAGAGTLRTLGPDSLTAITGAAQVVPGVGPTFSMRYFIDGKAGGTDTNIVVWSTGDQSGSHTVFMYDDKQNVKSVNFDLTHTELDWFDPEAIAGRPADFVDGFIDWNAGMVPADGPAAGGLNLGGSVYTYSIINAPAFGALQTVLGAHK